MRIIRKEVRTVIHERFSFKRQNLTKKISLLPDSPSAKLSSLLDELTVVTAYFNLGSFHKGEEDIFGPNLYHQWMTVFGRINNPLIIYVDTDDDASYFNLIRINFPRQLTRIVKVKRNDLWAFSLQPFIGEIYGQEWYPKHLPNTVRADYSCAMHAKYELMQRTIEENPFRTKYICWLDIGLFRHLTSEFSSPSVPNGPLFSLSVPVGFNSSEVAYTKIESRSEDLSLRQIIHYNSVWVCGAFFIGRVDIMFDWTVEYMDGVERMLEKHWMSTDQQVIYWIFNRLKPKTKIQTYQGVSGNFDYWFWLGYLAKEAGQELNQKDSHL